MDIRLDKSYGVNGKKVQPIQKIHRTTKTENRREENKHDQDLEKGKAQKTFQEYLQEKAKEGNKKTGIDTITISQKGRESLSNEHGER